MNFKPKNFVAVPSVPVVAVAATPFRVYFREKGKLGQTNVERITDQGESLDHRDAILYVKEALVKSGDGWNAPVLVVIQGGKNGN